MKKLTIKGSYHGKCVDIFISSSKKSVNSVTVFVNGLYGVFNHGEENDKINILVKKLTDENITHCVNYNSSRDFSFNSDADYGKRLEAFKDKTFLQELNDLKNVINWVVINCGREFGIKEGDFVLNVHGNSIGGTFAIMLGDFFPRIKKISLCGSGCGTNGSSKPILSTIFSEDKILRYISLFNGEILLLQGGDDKVVPLESGLKILKYAINADKKHIIVPHVNHNFSKINDVDNLEVKQKFIDIIFDFLSKV